MISVRFPGDASVQDRTMAVCRNWGWLLGCSMLLLLLLEWAQACGKLTVDPPTVLFGENIRASCAIPSNHCRMLKDGEIEVLWKLSGELLPGAQQYQHSDGTTVSNLTINHFNRTTASLGCYVLWNGTPQLVGLQTINAGYLPSRPKNLTCMMEIPKYKLMCQWDFRQDSLLPTSITLWGSKNKKPCQLPYDVISCNASVNQHFCIFPRLSLQLYQVMSFWVSATNALGSAE
uniref:Immunoglobulin C2-set-like ligand-binding domain-containing protein n=1 Tax=Sphenodon punctatus TaxID=8508 RepID=A0A8D0L213_SPHPU